MIDIDSILMKYNINPKKYMGQNFLIDENVLDKIIKAAEIKNTDTILEVGPGLGILTIALAKKAKQVIAIEKDNVLCQVLEKTLKDQKISNVKPINGDILKIFNFKFLISNQIPNSNYKIVANIPYYLTSPLIRKFLELERQPARHCKQGVAGGPELMVLMVQKEVAQRITANPPKMSILSIAVQFYAEPKIIGYVSKTSFSPIPKVDSAIIKITPKSIPNINTKKFFELVKRGFSAKRKMLKNNLPEINLEKFGLNPKIRAENLSVSDWLKIFASQNYIDK